MSKINTLKEIMTENNYTNNEQKFILSHLSPNWESFPQTKEEIEKQLYTSYGVWRGLGSAISNYIEFEKKSI
jgi:hypothetical protein